MIHCQIIPKALKVWAIGGTVFDAMGHEITAVPSFGVSDKKLFSTDYLPFSLETVIKKWKYFYPKWVAQVGSLLEVSFWVPTAQQKQNTRQQPCRAPSPPRQLRFSPELLSSCPSFVLWHRHMARPSPSELHLAAGVLRAAPLHCAQDCYGTATVCAK